jgi:hypothetical protein
MTKKYKNILPLNFKNSKVVNFYEKNIYTVEMASTGFNFEAFIAGIIPDIIPITIDKIFR